MFILNGIRLDTFYPHNGELTDVRPSETYKHLVLANQPTFFDISYDNGLYYLIIIDQLFSTCLTMSECLSDVSYVY